jgi:hypothetical protein
MSDEPDNLLTRAVWIRAEADSDPLHEPERVAVAIERVYAMIMAY